MYCYRSKYQIQRLLSTLFCTYVSKRTSFYKFQNQFPNITITHDKIITNGCSRKRPDIFIDLGYQVLIVEIDEDEHIDYDCFCENKRIMLLSQDINHRPLICIRFNPDSYTDNTNTKITSCFASSTVFFAKSALVCTVGFIQPGTSPIC